MAFSLSKVFSGLSKTATAPIVPTTVGIDVGGSTVKVVEIEETPNTIMLRTYGELQLAPYDSKPLGEVVSLDNAKRIEAVSDVMREAGVSGRRGALAMPLSSSFLTVIPITVNPQEDLATRIPVEARKYVPLPLTDVQLDWTELPKSGSSKTATKEVMLAAIENNALEEHRDLLTAIGMTGEVAEIEAFSLIRSLWRAKDSTLAILDLGARSSKLYIVREGQLERLHRVAIGGREISRQIAERLQISFEDAENLKRGYDRGEGQGQTLFQIMSTVLDNPLSEFGRLIGQYESRQASAIGRIVISGGVASSPYCLQYVTDRFGRQIEMADPFAKVAYPAFMEDTLRAIGPSFGVALGAALRRFQS